MSASGFGDDEVAAIDGGAAGALLTIVDARLPAAYESAMQALAECTRLDECQSWANKAEAMASYARQAKDDSLRKMADRIQARAIRRCGELLKQIDPANGANQNIQAGAHPKVTRESVAESAGLSEHQRKQALRVASVPTADFDRQVESDDPPTLTDLAAQGKQSRSSPRGALDERKPRATVPFSQSPLVDASIETVVGQSWVPRVLAMRDAIGRGDLPRPDKCCEKFTPAEIEKLRGALPAIICYLEDLRVEICPRCDGEGCAHCDPSIRRGLDPTGKRSRPREDLLSRARQQRPHRQGEGA